MLLVSQQQCNRALWRREGQHVLTNVFPLAALRMQKRSLGVTKTHLMADSHRPIGVRVSDYEQGSSVFLCPVRTEPPALIWVIWL